MNTETDGKTISLVQELDKAIENEKYGDTASSEAVSKAHADLAEHLEEHYTRDELEHLTKQLAGKCEPDQLDFLEQQIAEVLSPEP